ncbi:hypothetical protein CWC56_12190 [Enterococcus faecalis]|nr:hypothetical protein CUN42_12470 [Enterococcus faecalis]PQV99516.1 hypothetical protein CWC56_12190 [Enterococcus faecalis]PQW05009.1 hypothetical protein CWC55_03550 [Enterococcus faecalis]PQW14891.1 hypothetical protein CWC57_12560 [Enterococcus faecalis]RTK50683.1 hypothetical protein DRJ88_06170 [Enterococcus faecalis]
MVTVLNGSTSERYVDAYLSFRFHYSTFSQIVRINLALIREILKAVKNGNKKLVTVLNGSTLERYVEAYLSFHLHSSIDTM